MSGVKFRTSLLYGVPRSAVEENMEENREMTIRRHYSEWSGIANNVCVYQKLPKQSEGNLGKHLPKASANLIYAVS
jgi:hypothetical protein